MSSQGAANTNSPNAADRDKGLARAEDRMSAQGLAHEKATTHATKFIDNPSDAVSTSPSAAEMTPSPFVSTLATSTA